MGPFQAWNIIAAGVLFLGDFGVARYACNVIPSTSYFMFVNFVAGNVCPQDAKKSINRKSDGQAAQQPQQPHFVSLQIYRLFLKSGFFALLLSSAVTAWTSIDFMRSVNKSVSRYGSVT